MVTINKVYTRGGDKGYSSLGSGERRLKCDARIDGYGDIDELGCLIGLARIHVTEAQVNAELARIQNDLFDLGADLAFPQQAERDGRPRLRITSQHYERLEAAIDELNADLSPLTSFVLAGGSQASAQLHLARAVTRRAERKLVYLMTQDGEDVGEELIIYINRLSDYLFVAARFCNDKGLSDVLWEPGANITQKK